jgi:branched-chain amino acid transport system substrate-binding protein
VGHDRRAARAVGSAAGGFVRSDHARRGEAAFRRRVGPAAAGTARTTTAQIAAGIEELIRERGYRAGRYAIGYQSCDDSTVQAGSFDFAKCIANAKTYASDLDVIGVVGTYNSGCAQIEVPILNEAPRGPLAMVSPLNTFATLTRGNPALPGFREFPTGIRNYARVIAPDTVQYPADAVLAKQLGVRRVAVVTDRTSPYAIRGGRWFAHSARKLGLDVVALEWTFGQKHLERVAARVAATHADGVFFAGGGLPDGASLVGDVRRALPRGTPLIVSDYFHPLTQFEAFSHGAADGTYASTAGEPNDRLPPAGQRLLARLGPKPLWIAGAYGAAAAAVLLDAIARSDGTRRSVARELFRTRIRNGIVGDLAIGRYGDPVTAPVTIFRLRRGARNPSGVPDFQDAVVDRVITPPPSVVP